jgi:hypothetical protein
MALPALPAGKVATFEGKGESGPRFGAGRGTKVMPMVK